MEHGGEPLLAQTEVQEAGTGDGHFGKIGALQADPLHQQFSQLAGSHAQLLGALEAESGGIVAVLQVLGHLHMVLGQVVTLGHQAFGHGGAGSGGNQVGRLVHSIMDMVHNKTSFQQL